MNRINPMLVGLALASFFWAGAASAQAGAIELKTTAQKQLLVVGADGSEQELLVPPGKVIPGDAIVYTIEARNISTNPAERVVITDPIPEHMDYVDGSATADGTELLFSVDGGMSFDRAEALEVVEADGTRRPATSEDFTHIRWVFRSPLAPAGDASVRFVARVE